MLFHESKFVSFNEAAIVVNVVVHQAYNTLPIEIQCYFMKASLFLSKFSAQEYALFLPLPWTLGPKNA